MIITSLNKNEYPSEVSEVICIKCGLRFMSYRPVYTLLKEIVCVNCGKGYVIETGQRIGEDYLEPCRV